MFQSKHLFKSINCPYYKEAINSITCERPYCQFKHPKPQHAAPANPSEDTQTKEPAACNNDISGNQQELNQKLPNILKNLTSTLESVQKLIKSVNSTHSDNSDDQDKITNSLESLNSVITSLASSNQTETVSNSPKTPSKNSINSLKRQQMNAPTYTPTPIKELKNLKKPIASEDDEVTAKRQKKEHSVDSNVKASSMGQSKEPMKQELGTKQSDLNTFAKLTLSQQVQKRYEMMGKTAPTPVSLAEQRMKKIQASLGGPKGSSLDGSKSAASQKVPKLIVDGTNRIPLPMRQRFLTVIFENGRGNFATLEKACEKAAEQEKSIYDRSKNKVIYTNLAANLIKGLRDAQKNAATPSTSKQTSASRTQPGTMSLKNKVPETSKPQTQSHEAMLSGPKASRCTYSINRVKQMEAKDLSVYDLYKMFCIYVMSESELDANSFPKWIKTPSTEKRLVMIPNYQANKIASANKLDEAKKQHAQKQALKQEPNMITKLCKRCSRTFMLTSKDLKYLSSNSDCVHHWGKLRNVRVDKSVVQKYSCCNGGSSETGCETGKHVYEGDYDGEGTGLNMVGYVEASESRLAARLTCENIYAIDCEMCYTARGLEVTRVSVVDIHGNEVYESLVKPDTEILDYNTRWSGLTEEILRGCNKSLREVQKELLQFINKDTLLIGHSLDSDFKSLKLIHRKVIDTSVVFPHKLGLPYKRALRNLMSEHLQKIIQEDVSGHDSKEDAVSCIQLMMWKINEDLKNSKKVAITLGKTDAANMAPAVKSKKIC